MSSELSGLIFLLYSSLIKAFAWLSFILHAVPVNYAYCYKKALKTAIP